MRERRVMTETYFWKIVDKNGPLWNGTPCWLWTGCRDREGYGRVGAIKRRWKAHRLAWFYAHGPIPTGLFVCHHCDVLWPAGDTGYRACCNPAHLFLGTNADNLRDAARKGRTARGERNGTRLHPESHRRGAETGCATLTEEQVLEIRRLVADGTMTQQAIAQRLGRTDSNISRIINRHIWKHLP